MHAHPHLCLEWHCFVCGVSEDYDIRLSISLLLETFEHFVHYTVPLPELCMSCSLRCFMQHAMFLICNMRCFDQPLLCHRASLTRVRLLPVLLALGCADAAFCGGWESAEVSFRSIIRAALVVD